MYYVPVTEKYWSLPVAYVPYHSTPVDRLSFEESTSKLNDDLSQVKGEIDELRGELSDLRLEKDICPRCFAYLSTRRRIRCDEDCRLCYPRSRSCSREREVTYRRIPSPIHYCSICRDYVIDDIHPPPTLSRHKSITKKLQEDKLSEYLSRQLELQRIRDRYTPKERPTWIPTAYKNDYPYRRWLTRSSYFSEP